MADSATASGLRDDHNVCQLCGALENLSLCSGCHDTWYCCKDHQREDWKLHKKSCKEKQRLEKESRGCTDSGTSSSKDNPRANRGDQSKGTADKLDRPTAVTNPETSDTQASEETSNPVTQQALNLSLKESAAGERSSEQSTSSGAKKKKGKNYGKKGGAHKKDSVGQLPAIAEEGCGERFFLDPKYRLLRLKHSLRARYSAAAAMAPEGRPPANTQDAYVDVLLSRFEVSAGYVVKCLKKYGVCVMDTFVGDINGQAILTEVKRFRDSGVMQQGQVVHKGASTAGKIRGDIITWIDGQEPNVENIRYLVQCMDAVVGKVSAHLEGLKINERTKAMVACYPGKGSGYVRHVDNPNQDGRCITCIYYLNKNWDAQRDGGLLRIYPEGRSDMVADIEPKFDRVLFFWSDRRNPHEVLPAHKERFAITVWYYEAEERARALKQHQDEIGEKSMNPKKQAVPMFNGSPSSPERPIKTPTR